MATPYTFTQPIRYYKANDPYYYEVDNIPVRQLEENILYIKNKLEGGGGDKGAYLTESSELSIYQIKQLRPHVVGPRTVKVNAGRFVSRINDAFDIPFPLNYLTATYANELSIVPVLEQVPWITPPEINRATVWNSFITQSSRGYNTNGLAYTFTFHNTPGAMGSHWRTKTGSDRHFANTPQYGGGVGPAGQFSWPGSQFYGLLTPQELGQYIGFDQGNYISTNLPLIHLAFVQMWRGVFRTSVVDFDDSTIEIPSWSDDDFYYYDDDGNKVQINNVNQRIDLLVGYSLPIDSSGTAINNYEEGYCDDLDNAPVPQKMTIPTLGLVRGAGLGIALLDRATPVGITTFEGCESPGIPGSPRIVGNQNDVNINANTGITTLGGNKIHGSFPSPDDLLNLAPNLALNIEVDDLQLIGQAALPLAYVVVKKGVSHITQEDIIDIRPFLRTTEFTYNERAGIAAANPPLSLANPAVGAFQLQEVVQDLFGDDPEPDEGDSGKALYTDYIMGGLAYGVEGTMLLMADYPQGPNDPFGKKTTDVSYFLSNGDKQAYSFTEFKNTWTYLKSQDLSKREAYLEYVYRNRQGDLKRWISNPNYSIDSHLNQNQTYLGLPPGDGGRNIPLYPEWDMPANIAAYNYMVGNTSGQRYRSPKCTWWMYMEAQNKDRSLCYTPGGVFSNVPVKNWERNRTYKLHGFGYGADNGAEIGQGTICTVTKAIEITFPSWVVDYDILVEYVNCGPVTSVYAGRHQPDQGTYGFGSGLMVNKGPLVSIQGSQKATISINSASQPWPAQQGVSNSKQVGMIHEGALTDMEGTQPHGKNQVGSAGIPGRLWQNLSYTVCLPQFWQLYFRTAVQNYTKTSKSPLRLTPKFGGAYYPTVKFTVIGYNKTSVTNNTTYNQENNYTMIQNIQNLGKRDALTPSTSWNSIVTANAPYQGIGVNTRIDISQMS